MRCPTPPRWVPFRIKTLKDLFSPMSLRQSGSPLWSQDLGGKGVGVGVGLQAVAAQSLPYPVYCQVLL